MDINIILKHRKIIGLFLKKARFFKQYEDSFRVIFEKLIYKSDLLNYL